MILPREELFGKYISLLPLTGEVTGVTLEGFYYPLENAALRVGFPRAISNELADGAGQARITLAQGILIVIESKD
jgi:thiamine pyrophosphokinase